MTEKKLLRGDDLNRKDAFYRGYDDHRAIRINGIGVDKHSGMVRTPTGDHGPLALRPLQVLIARLFGITLSADIAKVVNIAEKESHGLHDPVTADNVRQNISRMRRQFPGLKPYVRRHK